MVTPIEVHFRSDILDMPDHKVMVVEFRGELDESNIDDTAVQIYKIIADAPVNTPFIFDFSQLNYMNSKSIGYLSDWFSKISEKGAELLIAAPRENISDILRTVGLDNFIKMFHSVDESKLAVLNNGTTEKATTNMPTQLADSSNDAQVEKIIPFTNENNTGSKAA
ncbi:MAG: STAS domain-containing protein [Candidatus Gracilibacteria bacterium]